MRTAKRQQLPANFQAAPLRELFWGEPETTLFEHATQRLAMMVDAAAAPESLQLFDDVYESAAC
jgi:hypothetical protein